MLISDAAIATPNDKASAFAEDTAPYGDVRLVPHGTAGQ